MARVVGFIMPKILCSIFSNLVDKVPARILNPDLGTDIPVAEEPWFVLEILGLVRREVIDVVCNKVSVDPGDGVGKLTIETSPLINKIYLTLPLFVQFQIFSLNLEGIINPQQAIIK